MRFDEDYYTQTYTDYFKQNPSYKIQFYLNLIRAYAPLKTSLLDVGCGLGVFLKEASSFYEVQGIEMDAYAVGECRKVLGDTKVTQSALEKFPSTKTFGVVTAFDVLEHIEDLSQALTQIKNLLVPKGLICVVVPVYDGPLGVIITRLDKDPTHLHKLSRETWLTLLKKEFELVDYIGILRYLLPGGWYLHIPTKLFRNITPAIMMVARKR